MHRGYSRIEYVWVKGCLCILKRIHVGTIGMITLSEIKSDIWEETSVKDCLSYYYLIYNMSGGKMA